MPKGETIKHGDFNISFHLSGGEGTGMLMQIKHSDGQIINAGTSDFKDLIAAVKHAKNHLKKYYEKGPVGAYYEKVSEGSFIKLDITESVAKEFDIIDGRIYVVERMDDGYPIILDSNGDPVIMDDPSEYELVQA